MVFMATINMILENGGRPTNSIISRVLLTIEHCTKICVKLKLRHMSFVLCQICRYTNLHIMDINENLKNEVNHKNINKHILARKYFQTTIVEY